MGVDLPGQKSSSCDRPMKVFLDVGAHKGETVKAVRDPKYRFDRIVCFEPVRSCVDTLRRLQDPRVEVCAFGLWKETCERPIFQPGALGASIFHDKGLSDSYEKALFVSATEWFRSNIGQADVVYAKLNCEGSECDLLDDLLDSGEITKIRHLLIYFDVRKIPSQRHREAEVRTRLLDHPTISVALGEQYRSGLTHVAQIQSWLDAVGTDESFSLGLLGRFRSRRLRVRYVTLPNAARWVAPIARRVIPGSLYKRMAWRARAYGG
jgi:FkbM family methyltransferase